MDPIGSVIRQKGSEKLLRFVNKQIEDEDRQTQVENVLEDPSMTKDQKLEHLVGMMNDSEIDRLASNIAEVTGSSKEIDDL